MCSFREIYNDSSYIISEDTRKKFVLKDDGESRQYVGINNKQLQVSIFKVDGGIITSNQINKCDFAFVVESDSIYFVELKGSDLSHACFQIYSTIKPLIDEVSITYKEVNARIVLSKVSVPRIKPTNEKLLEQVVKKHNGTYRKCCRIMEECI